MTGPGSLVKINRKFLKSTVTHAISNDTLSTESSLEKKIEHMKPDHITIFTVTVVVVVVASCCNFLNTDISGTRYDMNPPINL